MKWLKKLDNPALLVVQGFAVGALFFSATHPGFFDSVVERTAAALVSQIR